MGLCGLEFCGGVYGDGKRRSLADLRGKDRSSDSAGENKRKKLIKNSAPFRKIYSEKYTLFPFPHSIPGSSFRKNRTSLELKTNLASRRLHPPASRCPPQQLRYCLPYSNCGLGPPSPLAPPRELCPSSCEFPHPDLGRFIFRRTVCASNPLLLRL